MYIGIKGAKTKKIPLIFYMHTVIYIYSYLQDVIAHAPTDDREYDTHRNSHDESDIESYAGTVSGLFCFCCLLFFIFVFVPYMVFHSERFVFFCPWGFWSDAGHLRP